ncbi:SAM-dependent methyltransferase [Streptomyces sp. NPDC091383]|uniref:SAM-dependent methyltransferase n=1 Tax=Streptomyces sp. NPDC091383 TaxID=3365996 RepID=UPI00382A908E
MSEETAVLELDEPEVQGVWRPIAEAGVRDLAAHYVLASALVGTARAGIAERLSTAWAPFAGVVPPGARPHLVRNTLRYLEIHGVVESRGVRWRRTELDPERPEAGEWRLTARGGALLDEVATSLLGFYTEAYGPVLANVGGLLSGKVDYGTDVERDGEALGRRCERMTISFLAHLLGELMRERGGHSVLELGCGTGGLALHMAAGDPLFRAVGIDIAPEAIRLARERVVEQGVQDRLSFEVGDAFAPDSWPAGAADCDVYLAVGALHEEFRKGRQAVIDHLSRYRKPLAEDPKRVLLLAEPDLRVDAGDAEYYFMHVLTKQGFPQPRDSWLDVIEAAGLTCERVCYQPNVEFRFAFYMITAGR